MRFAMIKSLQLDREYIVSTANLDPQPERTTAPESRQILTSASTLASAFAVLMG